MTYDANIKFARAYDSQALVGPVLGTGTVYGKLQFLPSKDTIPLVCNHDPERQVGLVHELWRWPWTDQVWYVARCTIDTPPAWLRKGTPASFGVRNLSQYEFNGWTVVPRALVDEVTIVGPGYEPVESCTVVLTYRRAEPKPQGSAAAVVPSNATAAGEVSTEASELSASTSAGARRPMTSGNPIEN